MKNLATCDRRSFIALAAAGFAGCATGKGADATSASLPAFDENLSVIISDAHIFAFEPV